MTPKVYLRCRGDISVATFTRLVCAIREWLVDRGMSAFVAVRVWGAKDLAVSIVEKDDGFLGSDFYRDLLGSLDYAGRPLGEYMTLTEGWA